jgi:hypothetical protein
MLCKAQVFARFGDFRTARHIISSWMAFSQE